MSGSKRRTSRSGTSRPRKIAGQSAEPTAVPGDEQAAPSPQPGPEPAPRRADVAVEVDDQRVPLLASHKVTRMLLVLLGIATLALVLQGVWWGVHTMRDEPKAKETTDGLLAAEPDRPLTMNEVASAEGIDAAAAAVEAMMTRNWREYDMDVEEASLLLTASFAAEFRELTGDVKDQFVEAKAISKADILAQALVRTSDTEIQVLLFLDKTTTRTAGSDPGTVVEPYKALATMVHTDEGWFLEELETR